MKKLVTASIMVLAMAASAQAVPVLQVGAPGTTYPNPPDRYADYQATSPNPAETDTAITSGGTLLVAGVYQNSSVLNLGGKFNFGDDWSSFGNIPSSFDGRGAILVVSVPEGSSGTILIPGATYFAFSATDSYFPNNHAPVQSSIADFLFFDIGTFAKNPGAVPDFDSETGAADGEIKVFSGITITGYDWVHFDVMALETLVGGTDKNPRIVTNWEGNPGSHDVTWKPEDGGGGGGGNVVPEPGTFLLLGAGLMGLGLYGRKRKVK